MGEKPGSTFALITFFITTYIISANVLILKSTKNISRFGIFLAFRTYPARFQGHVYTMFVSPFRDKLFLLLYIRRSQSLQTDTSLSYPINTYLFTKKRKQIGLCLLRYLAHQLLPSARSQFSYLFFCIFIRNSGPNFELSSIILILLFLLYRSLRNLLFFQRRFPTVAIPHTYISTYFIFTEGRGNSNGNHAGSSSPR